MATESRDVSQKMVDWIIEELRYKAGIFKETGTISGEHSFNPMSLCSRDF